MTTPPPPSTEKMQETATPTQYQDRPVETPTSPRPATQNIQSSTIPEAALRYKIVPHNDPLDPTIKYPFTIAADPEDAGPAVRNCQLPPAQRMPEAKKIPTLSPADTHETSANPYCPTEYTQSESSNSPPPTPA